MESESLCPLCFADYTNPHRLPCGHIFCFECITKHINASKVLLRLYAEREIAVDDTVAGLYVIGNRAATLDGHSSNKNTTTLQETVQSTNHTNMDCTLANTMPGVSVLDSMLSSSANSPTDTITKEDSTTMNESCLTCPICVEKIADYDYAHDYTSFLTYAEDFDLLLGQQRESRLGVGNQMCATHTTVNATHFCSVGCQNLCSECYEEHKKKSAFIAHVPYISERKQEWGPIYEKYSCVCEKHHHPISFLRQDEKKRCEMLCYMCDPVQQRDRKALPLSKTEDAVKEDVAVGLSRLELVDKEVDEKRNDISKRQLETTKRFEHLKMEIGNYFDKLLDTIKQEKDRLTTEMDYLEKLELEPLGQLDVTLDQHKNTIKYCQLLAKDGLDFAKNKVTYSELLKAREYITMIQSKPVPKICQATFVPGPYLPAFDCDHFRQLPRFSPENVTETISTLVAQLHNSLSRHRLKIQDANCVIARAQSLDDHHLELESRVQELENLVKAFCLETKLILPYSIPAIESPIYKTEIKSFGSPGRGQNEFNYPAGLAVHPKTQEIYVCDYNNGRIKVLSSNLTFIKDIGGPASTSLGLKKPWSVAISNDGCYLAVSDYAAGSVHVFDLSQDSPYQDAPCRLFKKNLHTPYNVAFDHQNYLYVTDYHHDCIFKCDLEGKIIQMIGKEATHKLGNADSLVVGDDNFIYGASYSACNIQVYHPYGQHIRTIKTPLLRGNSFLARGPHNKIILSDNENNRILFFNGQGAQVHSMAIDLPRGIAVDSFGHLIVADQKHMAIRMFSCE